MSGTAAFAYIAFLRPAQGLDTLSLMRENVAVARPTPETFGRSGRVRMHFVLPGTRLPYPLRIDPDTATVLYTWVAHGADTSVDEPRDVTGGLVAPSQPGLYRLVVHSGRDRHIVDRVSLAVLVPFTQKRGPSLNGYRIGFYRGERDLEDQPDIPTGFVEIDTAHLDLPVSDRLRLGDFVTHDRQSSWPRYAAVDPRLLDKIELVLDEIESWYGGPQRTSVPVDVHSGFRTPMHNRGVPRSARDSRHQFGDALDLAIDANLDGRVNAADTKLVALAVEIVERAHPDLVGGMGIYTRSGSAYVHVDTRGQRVRWRG